MTDKPFGVNLTFLPGFNPDYPGYIEAIIAGNVRIVETAGRSPEQYMPLMKEAGIKVIHKYTGAPLFESRAHWLRCRRLTVLSAVVTRAKMTSRT